MQYNSDQFGWSRSTSLGHVRVTGIAEASELGLAPGMWPELITLDTTDGPFTLASVVTDPDNGGDVMWVVYRHASGSTLKIFND